MTFISLYLSVIPFFAKAVISKDSTDDIVSMAKIAEYNFRQIERSSDIIFNFINEDMHFFNGRIKRDISFDDLSSSCECGEGKINCLQTRLGKVCECESNRVVVNGMCTDCVCHNGVCMAETGQCRCRVGFGLQNNTCVECDCGEKNHFCQFVKGFQLCNCEGEHDYISVNQKCEDCVCGKHEICLKRPTIGVCICPKGSEAWSEECDDKCDCSDGRSCMYTGLEKICTCLPRQAKLNGECVDCDCGENAECEFVNEEKNCTCNDGYELHKGTCEECNCGDGHSCTFKNGSSVCLCAENYSEHNGICKECTCGKDERCEFIDGRKVCTCKKNFVKENNVCKECWCGEGHDSCYILGGIKVCICREGFSDNMGKCEKCDCGTNHVLCEFQNGQKKCECLGDYADNNGTCQECFCGENSTCFFVNGEKTCLCPDGQVQRNETCSDVCSSDTCDRGTCEADGSESFCNCEDGFSGFRCDEEVFLSQGAIYLISLFSGVTLFWIILLLVYFIKKRSRY